MTQHAQTLLALATGFLALAALVWGKINPVARLARQLNGDPGDKLRGIASRPGILERQTISEMRDAEFALALEAMRHDLDTVKSQVTPNGGSSLKDIAQKTYEAVSS